MRRRRQNLKKNKEKEHLYDADGRKLGYHLPPSTRKSAVPKDLYDIDYPIIGISEKSKTFPYSFLIEWENGEKSYESYENISLKALAAYEIKHVDVIYEELPNMSISQLQYFDPILEFILSEK